MILSIAKKLFAFLKAMALVAYQIILAIAFAIGIVFPIYFAILENQKNVQSFCDCLKQEIYLWREVYADFYDIGYELFK